MKKINILELESSKGWGGQEKRTVRLVNSLDKNKFNVYWAVSENSKLFKNRKNIDAKFIPVEMKKSYDIKAIKKIINIIKKYNIDIISTHSGKDGWIGAIAGLFTNTKVIRTRHLQTPISSTFSYNLSDKVVTVSKQVENYLLKKGVKEEKLLTIYTGIDTDQFSPEIKIDIKNELNLPKNTIIIGIVAVLRTAKRHIDLIEAFSNIKSDKNIALIIIGSGPQKNNIKNFIKEKNLKNIYMLGHRENIDKILPSFDIFVLPSEMEALGTAILEASACGVACIGSNVGGIPEVIKDNKTGFLFESKNIKDLQNKLEKLINDDKLRRKFGKKAREEVLKNFSVKKMVENTQKLYENIVK